ncbi:flavodoxin family protein [Stenotrophomonas pavanii]|uniref:flavodoxin family protein n=1 Tax=Stenotrophomonas pavanii TaxID=487698 RepID=UPI0039C65DBD
MMLWTKFVVVLIALAALIKAIDLCATQVARRKLRKLEAIEPHVPPAPDQAKVLVVYFSRSGSTALLARRIASRLNAEMLTIESIDYPLGMAGWLNAMADAGMDDAWITPAHVDLVRYDTVYVGVPVWRGHPAPPAWEFVRSNRFPGKRVVLFTTSRGAWRQAPVDLLRSEVLRRGARSFEHRHLKGGVVGFQGSDPQRIDPQ